MLRPLSAALGALIFSFFSILPIAKAQSSMLVTAQDIAIALPLESQVLANVGMPVGPGAVLFPKSWFGAVRQSFMNTSVGSALDTESPYELWHVIAARVAVCNPLVQTPKLDIDLYCWPELRLVLQPIERNVRLHERFMPAMAYDRAIHALYPLVPRRTLNATDSARVESYISRIQAASMGTNGQFAPLTSSEIADFVTLRRAVVRDFVEAALALRVPPPAGRSWTRDLALRDEAIGPMTEQKIFAQGFSQFLKRFAQPLDLGAMTAFSLPEGQEPSHIDEWVFIAFTAKDGQLSPQNIDIRSTKDGRSLAEFGYSMAASQSREAPRLYDLLEESGESSLFEGNVIQNIPDIARLRNKIADRRQILVPNTTCASCHKLNDIRFDFHNFSYLEDRDLTISPRVVRDVTLDLNWLRREGLSQ